VRAAARKENARIVAGVFVSAIDCRPACRLYLLISATNLVFRLGGLDPKARQGLAKTLRPETVENLRVPGL
jgi:hypothetical protein